MEYLPLKGRVQSSANPPNGERKVDYKNYEAQ